MRPYLPLLIKSMRVVAGVCIAGSLLMIVLAVTIPGSVKNVGREVGQDIGHILFMVMMLGNAQVIERLSRNIKRQ